MVKNLEFEGTIEFASPETVFGFLYEDDAFVKFYQKEVNDDHNASATSWSEEDGGRRREVTFKPRITNVPAIFRPFLGGDMAQLTEVQHYTRDGNAFTIHSELSVAAFSGTTLVTHGDTSLSPAEKGCAIVVKLTLELETSVWGLKGQVEMYAEIEARDVFKRWLNIARVFCEKKMGLEEEPSFHDAEEVISTEERNINPITGLPNSLSFGHSESGLLVQELRRNFRITHAKLQKIEREILLLRSCGFLFKAWTAFGLGIATGLGLGFLYNRQLSRHK